MIPGCRRTRITDAVDFAFFLELIYLALYAFLGKTQCVDEFFELRDTSDHAGPVDDQLSHRIHHAVEAFERDADGFCGCGYADGLLSSFFARSFSQRRGRYFAGKFGFVAVRYFLGNLVFLRIQWSKFGNTGEQRIDSRSHFGLVGPLLVERLLQDIDGFEAQIDNRRGGIDLSVPEAADQVFYAVGYGAQPTEAHLRSRALYRVNRAE